MFALSSGREPRALCLIAQSARDCGRVYAAYVGVYIGVALLWLRAVDGIKPTAWDMAGVGVALTSMGVIMFQPR